MDFETFLAHWATNKNASPRTIRAYRNDLDLFEDFCHERGIRRITQVDHAVINSYIEHMQSKPNPRFHRTGLADSSIARRLAALSSYFEYVRATSNHKLHNPLRDLTRRWTKNDDPKPVDDITLEKLLAGITNLRDKVLITLFVSTGLRVSEMYQLDRETIHFELETDEQDQEHVRASGEVIGKGNKRRTFFVDEQTLELYAEYMAARTDTNPALFLSERRQRMSVRAIQYTLDIWCKKLGLSHINVHALRHSYATQLANANIRLDAAQGPDGSQQPFNDTALLQAARYDIGPRLLFRDGILAPLADEALVHIRSDPKLEMAPGEARHHGAVMDNVIPFQPTSKSRLGPVDQCPVTQAGPFEPFVDEHVVAGFLAIAPRRVVEMARKGTIPAHPLGEERKTWRFRLSEIDAHFSLPSRRSPTAISLAAPVAAHRRKLG